MIRRLTLLAMIGQCGACGPDALEPVGHVVVSITTDAPLPAPAGAPAPELSPLFDRLRIELFPSAAGQPCAGCTREVAVDHELLNSASFSVTAEHGLGDLRLRVRLYRSGGTASGEPRAASTIETVARLPALPSEGGIEQHVVLRTDDVGAPRGTLDEPVELARGAAPVGLVGSFWGAARASCAGAPPDGAVCVPGGAFWMGNPRLDLAANPEIDGALEHLVVLSPFWLDAEEVSVQRFRESELAISLVPGGPSDNPHEAGTGIASCTYTSGSGPNDALPVNCISWSLANAYCEKLGRRLPTEAELEYAGSALGRSAYVWGAEAPKCGDAVFDCSGAQSGPAAPGSGARDRLRVSAGEPEIVDLAGNVRELTIDFWNRQDEPCWSARVLHDPRCETPSPGDGLARSTRGGHFDDLPALLQASVRSWLANETQAVSALIGFRCAENADPAAANQ